MPRHSTSCRRSLRGPSWAAWSLTENPFSLISVPSGSMDGSRGLFPGAYSAYWTISGPRGLCRRGGTYDDGRLIDLENCERADGLPDHMPSWPKVDAIAVIPAQSVSSVSKGSPGAEDARVAPVSGVRIAPPIRLASATTTARAKPPPLPEGQPCRSGNWRQSMSCSPRTKKDRDYTMITRRGKR